MFSMAYFLSIKMNATTCFDFYCRCTYFRNWFIFYCLNSRTIISLYVKYVNEVNTVVQDKLIAIRTVNAYVKGDYENESLKNSSRIRTIVKKLFVIQYQHALFQYMMYTPMFVFSLESMLFEVK